MSSATPLTELDLFKNHGKPSSNAPAAAPGKKAPLVQGVYRVALDHGRLRVNFVPVLTGITGTTDIEVTKGLAPGDEIVSGRYKILRTLKSGTAVKRDNSIAVPTATSTDDSSS